MIYNFEFLTQNAPININKNDARPEKIMNVGFRFQKKWSGKNRGFDFDVPEFNNNEVYVQQMSRDEWKRHIENTVLHNDMSHYQEPPKSEKGCVFIL